MCILLSSSCTQVITHLWIILTSPFHHCWREVTTIYCYHNNYSYYISFSSNRGVPTTKTNAVSHDDKRNRIWPVYYDALYYDNNVKNRPIATNRQICEHAARHHRYNTRVYRRASTRWLPKAGLRKFRNKIVRARHPPSRRRGAASGK